MQHARRQYVGVAAEDVIGLAGIFANDVGERHVGEARSG